MKASDPIRRTVAIVPHATDPLPFNVTRAVYVGTAGDLVVRFAEDSQDTVIKNAPVGWHPICVTHVRASSAALNLIAGY